MNTHLCLSCRHADWRRDEKGRLTGFGFCEAPDPKLPELPASKWWHAPGITGILGVRGGNIYRKNNFNIANCHFYEKAKP